MSHDRLFQWSQKFCKFSAFSLEFEKIFSVIRIIFLIVGQNNFGNKIPFSQFHKSFFLQYERQKKLEREHKKKQEAQSLEETKEQITQLEKNLTNFKKDKHELFHTLKKVLFEDDTRRRSKEAPHPPQPQLYMQSAIRPPHGSVYMKPNPQLLISKYKYSIIIFAFPIAQRTNWRNQTAM